MNALPHLEAAGIEVIRSKASGRRKRPSQLAVIDVHAGAVTIRFALEERRRAPYPNELPGLDAVRQALSEAGNPLLSTPFIGDSLGTQLVEAGWSWADDQGNYDLRAPGLLLRQRRTSAAPKPTRRHLPLGSGSLAIIRSLIGRTNGQDGMPSTTVLGAQAGVSQPRASQVLGQLRGLGLVNRLPSGRWQADREALLDRFLAEYPGPGGTEGHYYSLEPPTEVAALAARSARGGRLAISADVGPDLVAPWRRPSLVVCYSDAVLPPRALGAVEAQGRHDANVIVRAPEDRSVFPLPDLVADVAGTKIPLADPAQMLWDLHDLGGADRLEAAGILRTWLLRRP